MSFAASATARSSEVQRAGFETEVGEERRERARAKTPGSRNSYAAVGGSGYRNLGSC